MPLFFLFFGLLMSFACHAVDERTYIPKNAYQYLETIQVEKANYFPQFQEVAYFPALIEHESCVSLLSKTCFSQYAKLSTQRELGAGFGQITKVYNKDGSVRFDSLSDMRRKHKELTDWNWNNVFERPDLQIRSILLMIRDNDKFFFNVKDPKERAYFDDAAYNRGPGNIQKERVACGMRSDCDPQRWFGNVANHCLGSHQAIYGQRSACDINRHHVDNVFNDKLPKYQRYYQAHP